jgi:hypothetical protein
MRRSWTAVTDVGVGPSVEVVGAGSADERVGAGEAEEGVVAGATVEPVGQPVSGEPVGVGGADKNLDVGHEVVVPWSLGAPSRLAWTPDMLVLKSTVSSSAPPEKVLGRAAVNIGFSPRGEPLT